MHVSARTHVRTRAGAAYATVLVLRFRSGFADPPDCGRAGPDMGHQEISTGASLHARPRAEMAREAFLPSGMKSVSAAAAIATAASAFA